MKPYTPAAYGLTGLPGPTGRGIQREAAFQHRRSLKRMAPVPRPSCFYSREGLTLKPANPILLVRCDCPACLFSHTGEEPAMRWDVRRLRAARLSSP